VQLVQVDPLEPQSTEAFPAALLDALRAAVRAPLAGAIPEKARLGRDHEPLGIRMEGLGDQLLADLRTVGVGCVDQVDAELHRAAEDRERGVAVRRWPPDALAGDPHRAEAEAAHRELATEGELPGGGEGVIVVRCQVGLLPRLP
jgi:hypothetical protein